MDRRAFLRSGFALGCAAAAAPALTPLRLLAAPGENRLVVIVLRGAMDGLGIFPPAADREYAALRPGLAAQVSKELVPLDGRFGMDGRLAALEPLWRAEELAVAHAVSTPYRDKRSHFDGQDLLENGGEEVGVLKDGWLNRVAALLPGATAAEALSVGRDAMLLTSGAAPFGSWAPGQQLILRNDERGLLTRIYAQDPLFAEAVAMAEALSADAGERRESAAAYAARRLAGEARIAAFSIGGWDTHANQHGALGRPLAALSEAILALRSGLGPAWSRTLVVAMTEFGRTARENGNRGTDHGTGGAALLAGGALRGGRIYGSFPGIAERQLYGGRDLEPTEDVRRHAAWAISAQFGLPRAALETAIFPGLDMGGAPGWLA